MLQQHEGQPEGVDAIRFQLRHEDDVGELDKLRSLQLLERNDKNKFVVPMRAVVEMRGRDAQADALLALCDTLFVTLKAAFKRTPERNLPVPELIREAGLPENKARYALQYVLQSSIWGNRSSDLNAPDAYVRASENILRYKTYNEVIKACHQWKLPVSILGASNRDKQQKFGILDSPELLSADLNTDPGALGRALLYIDLDDFKSINTRLTETVVDQDVLPAVHQALLGCVESIGFAYGEGGDEFTILLPNVSVGMAREFADSVRDVLGSLKFKGRASAVRITASIGLAHEITPTHGSLLKEHANLAKQKSKERGKNRTTMYEESEVVPSQ